MRGLSAGGVTIFLTTQYLDEADELADRVAVLDLGHIVAEGTPRQLKRRVPAATPGCNSRTWPTWTPPRKFWTRVRDPEALTLDVPTDGSPRSLKNLLDRLDLEALSIDNVTVHTADLDDVFFALTGHPHGETPDKDHQL